MAALFDNHFQANDANGAPMAGAKLFFFVAGTTTALVTYQDAGATTPHANPVVADAMGLFPPIYIVAPLYKFTLQTAGNVTIQTVDPAASVLLPGYSASGLLYGMGTSNSGADLANDILIDPGACIDQTNTVFMQTGGMVKQLDAVWSAGTNAGGRAPAESLVDGTWNIFAIFRTNTGTTDFILSQNEVNPFLPPNYTHYRRIASFVRSGGTNLRYEQDGDYFRYHTPVADLAMADPGTAAATRTVTVPALSSGVRADIRMAIQSTVVSQVINAYLNDTKQADYTLGAISDLRSVSLATAGTYRDELRKSVRANSGTVRTKQDFSSAGVTLILTTYGWTDDRGRFGEI